MAVGMGLENQGGPAIGFLPELPTPTVPRGMSMAGMDHAAHEHEPAPRHQHEHAPAPSPQHQHAPAPSPQHRHAPAPSPQHQPQHAAGTTDDAGMHAAMEFLARLLDDAQVEARIHASPELHRLWSDPALQRQLETIRRMHPPPSAGRHEHR
jgi:hypothetical protein